MIDGFFLELRDFPAFKVPVEFNKAVTTPEFILDTGFSGYLKVDLKTASDLGIDIDKLDVVRIYNANGQDVAAGFALGFAQLEGKNRSVEIIVAPGPHLLGIKFLSIFDYKAVVDCKNWICHLEVAP